MERDCDDEFAIEELFKFLDANQKKKYHKISILTNKGNEPIETSKHDETEEPDKNPAPKSPRLLEPDHPLLERFQRAFKQHLVKQVAALSEEVFELETGTKKLNQNRDAKGIETYDAQQIVARQQNDLDQYINELRTLSAVREQSEIDLRTTGKLYKEEAKILAEANHKELELRNEVESLNLLLQQLSGWETDVENELIINQRISEKTRKDKLKLADEKRTQDMFVYKLQTEVWRLENDLDTMVMQLRVKEEEREKLARNVVTSNIDIESNESEHKCLIHGWQSVITAIQNRDKEFNATNKELVDVNEKIRSTISETETVKKLGEKEMIQNETLTMFKMRVDLDVRNTTHQIEVESNKRNTLERNINKTQNIIDRIDEDIQRVTFDNNRNNHDLNILTREYESLCFDKNNLESSILALLQDQITNDKAAKYLHKLVNNSRDTNTRMEINLANLENSNAQLLMQIEGQRYVNESAMRVCDEMTKEQNLVDQEVAGYMEESKKCIMISAKNMRTIEILSKKLEKALEKTGGVEISPYEQKAITLQQTIEDVQENSKELEKYWLREQGHVVALCEQRQAQINDLNLLRKQILILDQKNLKVGDDLVAHKKKEELMNRNIYGLQNKLEMCTKALDKKKVSKEYLDSQNSTKQTDYTMKLEDLELETIRLDSTVTEMEEDKVALTRQLIENNREVLEWEKKLQMILETKQTMKNELSESGEVGHMKSEIHRMEVRYSQLKRAQEKMIHDLEHCVARRDGIVTNAVAREKRKQGTGGGGSDTATRFHFHKKLDDLRNKIKHMQNDIVKNTEKITTVEEERSKVDSEVSKLENEIAFVQNEATLAQELIEKYKTDKLLNLEILVLKQRKQKVYVELSKGRSPFTLYKTELALNAEYEKLRDLNDKLLIVLDNLLTDFPKHVHSLNRINNSLKLPILYL